MVQPYESCIAFLKNAWISAIAPRFTTFDLAPKLQLKEPIDEPNRANLTESQHPLSANTSNHDEKMDRPMHGLVHEAELALAPQFAKMLERLPRQRTVMDSA